MPTPKMAATRGPTCPGERTIVGFLHSAQQQCGKSEWMERTVDSIWVCGMFRLRMLGRGVVEVFRPVQGA